MLRDPLLKATLARATLIGQLSKSNRKGAAALAATLTACTPKTSCRSAACPVCGLAFQQAAVSLVERFIRMPARLIRGRMTALTIVPASGCLDPDNLSTRAFREVGAEITEALARLRLPPAIIGLEASFNEDTTGRLKPHWCVHGHAILIGWLSQDQQQALAAAFPSSRFVKRPVKAEPLDERDEGLLYPFKPERPRRVTVLNSDHPTRKPFRESKPRPLRPSQAVSLAIAEHRLGFSKRLLTHGIDEAAVRQLLAGLGWPRDGP